MEQLLTDTLIATGQSRIVCLRYNDSGSFIRMLMVIMGALQVVLTLCLQSFMVSTALLLTIGVVLILRII